ncbi:uncharacterized protein Z518_09162 [Rhinocladiella mackenziei CBS 650.93]|uniref:non-specific serine/threonine protein kinase n=1 Tax=Rhinocladiella mackenziei CBS 650.93 TaxID=1442369 RepID=A0A0D2IDV2_9EURO|nr:uncharacterized protein Z518_09162 [Rhinocladiella mackenziei CBS 650.93]KIX01436.1 hypothetical protein Z518_09162 [Rhinocladiella mackenziei CBS 650.93]
MSPGDRERKSLEGRAPEPLSLLFHQKSIEERHLPSQILPSSFSPPSSTSGNYIQRLQPGSSPFFASSRSDCRPRGASTFSRQGGAATTSPEKVPPPSTPEALTSSFAKFPSSPLASKAEGKSKHLSRRPTQPFSPSPPPQKGSNRSLSRAPRRVIRPDNFWQKDRKQSPNGLDHYLPPPVVPKSPLRFLLSVSTPAGSPTAESPTQETQDSESLEDRVLWEKLSPPPLVARKTRAATSPGAQPKPATANPEAPKTDPPLSPTVIAQRQRALEILESSPEVVDPNPGPQISKFERQRRRAAFSMDHLHPDSAAATGMTAHRREAVRLAEVQQRAVLERCKRSKQPEPDYAFDELIGKGSFGRVYKGRQLSTNKVVAIKVLDIDEADFRAYGEHKDEQIRDFNREIRILRQAQESGAENLNQMIEALPVHSQLWLICEYCPGGSVKTLMRATNDRLSERYIVVVARELAKALKGLHEAGIMHRDVKAANVLIHQEGHLELCDFGVATVLDTRTDKRKTFIGTLHWMPPELWTENPEYSDEVDVWEYGCTLYECAVGRPPNSDLRERQQLKMRMRRLKQSITLPENENFSDGLRSLISYTLNPDVSSRPSMKDILQHDFLQNTEESHPTNILTELVQTYYAWLFGGGQRISLFMPGGAAAASEDPDADIDPADEWNFSMTQDFERRVSAILEIPDLSGLSANETMEGEETPKGLTRPSGVSPSKEMTAIQKANFEARVKRGADLSNIFDQSKPAYEYKTKTDFVPIPEQRRISDLPFRAMAEDRPSSIASNVIDLGDFDEADYAVAAAPRTDDKIQTTYAATPLREETIRLADASTLREKRANSKGPREPIAQSLTARRASSAEGVPRSTSVHDFGISQEDWTVKSRTKAPELQEPAEIASRHPGHATMDWSFANAMSEAAIPPINKPEEPTSTLAPSESAEFEQKAQKHATMDWSFSSAMAEANAHMPSDQVIDPSPPTQYTRPPPTRPAPLTRQMTMPVTIGDFAQAEEREIPRPSTALSEAYSDISATSTDVDPFGLERDEDDHPGPATLEEDVAGGMGDFYSGRGRTMLGDRVEKPYYNSFTTSTPLTASGPAPYSLDRPARIDEDGFPGPSASRNPSLAASSSRMRASGSSVLSWTSTATAIPSRSGSVAVVEVPSVSPPSDRAMGAGASNDDVEAELTRLLEGMQGALNAAREVVGGLERRERRENEWIDEE